MKTLEQKSPSIKKAISELKTISRSPKSRELYEARRKAELDYNSNMNGAFRKGKAEGFEEGIEKGKAEGIHEGIEKGIQLNLETRFGVKDDDSLMKEIRKIKDIETLKKILIQSAKAKTLVQFKKSVKV